MNIPIRLRRYTKEYHSKNIYDTPTTYEYHAAVYNHSVCLFVAEPEIKEENREFGDCDADGEEEHGDPGKAEGDIAEVGLDIPDVYAVAKDCCQAGGDCEAQTDKLVNKR